MSADRSFLLVIDPNPETAARINSALRNAGISVHVLHADNPSEAERLVREFTPFLIYFLPENQARFPIGEAARIAEANQVFLGVALSGTEGQALFEEASASAAALGIGDEAQLPAIARRLVGLGRAASNEERIRAQGEELEHRLDLLLNSTREPVAYFHEGLHVAANSAYLELLGVSSFDELSIVSLLEVLHQDGTDMKGLIRNLGDATYPTDDETFELRPRNGDPKPVHLSFAPVRYEDEDCVQMLVRFPGEHSDARCQPGSPCADAGRAGALGASTNAAHPGFAERADHENFGAEPRPANGDAVARGVFATTEPATDAPGRVEAGRRLFSHHRPGRDTAGPARHPGPRPLCAGDRQRNPQLSRARG